MDALDYFAIQNLIHRYADLLDRGKIDEVGALFDHADVYMPGEPEPWSRAGQNKMAEIFRQWTRFFPDADGRPRTRHVTTNLIIEEDGRGPEGQDACRARVRRCLRGAGGRSGPAWRGHRR